MVRPPVAVRPPGGVRQPRVGHDGPRTGTAARARPPHVPRRAAGASVTVRFANISEQATAVGDGGSVVFDVPGSIPSVRLSGRDVHDRRRNATRAVTDGVALVPPARAPRERAAPRRSPAAAGSTRLYSWATALV